MIGYLQFKYRWKADVISEGKPPALELRALRDTKPALTKAKIINKLKEASCLYKVLNTLPFVGIGGGVVYVNVFSVNNIFKSRVGRERMNVKPGDFPHHSN